ncbi:uncharacterized protein [Triticum aestivum]|uniref:uncharacterized protein isoform X2 n=1 Tax=Triticum aestivum TaxID=4565 RepID=UPI001D033362|nr:uncharacterized protein LOC123044414 isoform X2 [Triticum aestivum]
MDDLNLPLAQQMPTALSFSSLQDQRLDSPTSKGQQLLSSSSHSLDSVDEQLRAQFLADPASSDKVIQDHDPMPQGKQVPFSTPQVSSHSTMELVPVQASSTSFALVQNKRKSRPPLVESEVNPKDTTEDILSKKKMKKGGKGAVKDKETLAA